MAFSLNTNDSEGFAGPTIMMTKIVDPYKAYNGCERSEQTNY
jgi:hypothetical protein